MIGFAFISFILSFKKSFIYVFMVCFLSILNITYVSIKIEKLLI